MSATVYWALVNVWDRASSSLQPRCTSGHRFSHHFGNVTDSFRKKKNCAALVLSENGGGAGGGSVSTRGCINLSAMYRATSCAQLSKLPCIIVSYGFDVGRKN